MLYPEDGLKSTDLSTVCMFLEKYYQNNTPITSDTGANFKTFSDIV